MTNSTQNNQQPDTLVLGTSSITCVRTLRELEAIQAELDLLSNVPFLQSSWMFPWLETNLSNDCELNFLVVRNQTERIIGYAPLVMRSSLKRARHLVFIGNGKAAADYMTLPAANDKETDVINAIEAWLTNNDKQWDRMELDGVSRSDRMMKRFALRMEHHGNCDPTIIDTVPTWRMKLAKSWEELSMTLPTDVWQSLQKQEQTLELKSQLHQAMNADSLHEGLRILEYLHTADAKSRGENGCYDHAGFREFLSRVAARKLDEGKLSLIWLTYMGKPVAADIAFYDDDGAYTYQRGESPQHAELQPGRSVTRFQMELAMLRDCSFFDFLRGEIPYSIGFEAKEIGSVRYEFAGRSSRARATQAMLQIGRSIKPLINRDGQE